VCYCLCHVVCFVLSILLPLWLLNEVVSRHMGVNELLKVASYAAVPHRESNPRPLDCKSDVLRVSPSRQSRPTCYNTAWLRQNHSYRRGHLSEQRIGLYAAAAGIHHLVNITPRRVTILAVSSHGSEQEIRTFPTPGHSPKKFLYLPAPSLYDFVKVKTC